MMKSNLHSLLWVTIATAAFATCSVVVKATCVIGSALRAARDRIVDFMLAPVAMAKQVGRVADLPLVRILVAKAFVARAARRDRPRIESNFRMCPSV